ITRLRAVPSVRIEIQLPNTDEVKRLQRIIQGITGSSANISLRQLLREVLGRLPGLISRLLDERIKGLEAGKQPHDLRVGTLASYLGIGIRRLEQISRMSHLPRPKDLVDHVTLLWLAYGAAQKGWATAQFAREVGVSTLSLYRMRRRLLRRRSREEMR